jgi:ribulose 1,5-bisphosphate carboxylase large subunit-like protein
MLPHDSLSATYIISPAGGLEDVRATLERYTSVSTEAKLERMLSHLSPILGGDVHELSDRLAHYASRIASISPLPGSREFLVELEVPRSAVNLVDDGVAHLLALFAGNVFRARTIHSIRWIGLSLPDDYLEDCSSVLTQFGIPGLKSHLRIDRNIPLIAANVQPAFGMNVTEYAKMCVHIAAAGAHFIVEDELLTELPFCRMSARIPAVVEALEDRGHPIVYLVNALGCSDSILRKAAQMIRALNESRGNVLTGVVVDPFFAGFNTMRLFRSESAGPIFCHYYSSGLFVRPEESGISVSVLSTLAMLGGADIVYVGSVAGDHLAEDPSILELVATRLREQRPLALYPAVAGGINATNLVGNLRRFGKDVVLHVGAGLFGHPMGPAGGVRALKKMIDLACDCCLQDYSRKCRDCPKFVAALRKTPELEVVFRHALPE